MMHLDENRCLKNFNKTRFNFFSFVRNLQVKITVKFWHSDAASHPDKTAFPNKFLGVRLHAFHEVRPGSKSFCNGKVYMTTCLGYTQHTDVNVTESITNERATAHVVRVIADL